jgi:hypothetical protein
MTPLRKPNREVSPHVTLDELIAREMEKLALPTVTGTEPDDNLIDPEFDEEGDTYVAQY